MVKSYNSPMEHVDYNAIIDGTKGNGVVSGLIVTERGAGQNMSVDVSAGSAMISKVEYTEVSIVNVVITAADATHPRKDIIIYDVATTNPAVVTGTPAAEPIPPNITSGDILLAIVNVAANETTIANTDIEDGRITIQKYPNLHGDQHGAGSSDPISTDVLNPQKSLTTATDASGSRVCDGTVYQNTSARLKIITISITNTLNLATYIACSDSNATPTTEVAKMCVQSGGKYYSLTFAVLPNHYYKITASGGATTKIWLEIY